MIVLDAARCCGSTIALMTLLMLSDTLTAG